NPNPIPLPLVEALVAFTAYPGQRGGNNLGSVCLAFCESGYNCVPAADACATGGPQIRTTRDFAYAAAGVLLATPTGQTSPDQPKIRTLQPHATTRVTVALALDPMQLVGLLSRFATTAIDQVKRGSVPRFEIPYSVEGSAWVSVQAFGKIAAGFGPIQGVWQIQ